MREAEQDFLHPQTVGDFLRASPKFDRRRPPRFTDHLNFLPADSLAKAGSQSFEQRFFGGEPAGIRRIRIPLPLTVADFSFRIDPVQEALTPFLDDSGNPLDLDHVDADSHCPCRPLPFHPQAPFRTRSATRSPISSVATSFFPGSMMSPVR